jgi:uncharacterized membrane protein
MKVLTFVKSTKGEDTIIHVTLTPKIPDDSKYIIGMVDDLTIIENNTKEAFEKIESLIGFKLNQVIKQFIWGNTSGCVFID